MGSEDDSGGVHLIANGNTNFVMRLSLGWRGESLCLHQPSANSDAVVKQRFRPMEGSGRERAVTCQSLRDVEAMNT